MANGEETEFNICYGCGKSIPTDQFICPHCGTDLRVRRNAEDLLPEGMILNGKYLVGRTLGRGGFGVTYMGFDLMLETRVAIKEYFPMGISTRSPQSVRVRPASADMVTEGYIKGSKAFQDEAKTLARFNSPNIVRVRDYFLDNGTAYIVMDYIEGNSLSAEIRESGGRLPADRVLELFRPLISELAILHKKKLIHRDIKPDNLRVTRDPEHGTETLVLLDFGSARSFISENVTGTYTAMVTHGYAPIEQYDSESRQGPYTDVYALCATMYAAMTGKVPPAATKIMLDGTPITPPSQLGVEISPSAEKALMHGLAIRAENRPQTMTELYAELYGNTDPAAASPGRSVTEDPQLTEVAEPSVRETRETVKEVKEDETVPEPSGAKSKPKIWVWLLLAALLAGAGFFAWVNFIPGGPHSQTETTLALLTQSALGSAETRAAELTATQEADLLTATVLQEQELAEAARRTQTAEAEGTAAAQAALATATAEAWEQTQIAIDQAQTAAAETAAQQAIEIAETAAVVQQELDMTAMAETASANALQNTRTAEALEQEQTALSAQRTQQAVDTAKTAAAERSTQAALATGTSVAATASQHAFDLTATAEAQRATQAFIETGTSAAVQETLRADGLTATARIIGLYQTQTALVQDATWAAVYATQTKQAEPTATPTMTRTATPKPTCTATPIPTRTATPKPPTNTLQPTAIPARQSLKVGDIITFGHYEQDNNTGNGAEAIEWQVLAVENGRALVVSRYGLDAKPYNEELVDVTWETCTLRSWLNGEFYNRAFSSSERSQILQVTLQNPNNPDYGTKGGNSTTDQIFLLSIDEVRTYFINDAARQCELTAYAKANGAWVNSDNGYSYWWLRSPGINSNNAANVNNTGNVNTIGNYVRNTSGAVRPAFWLDL